MKKSEYLNRLSNGMFDETLSLLYTPQKVLKQKMRITDAIKKFFGVYSVRDEIHVFSAPGRTEIGGNHTDHQHGCVIAAAVDLDVLGVASFHNDGVIRIRSEGYNAFEVSLDDLELHPGETGTPAIVRGIASGFSRMNVNISGFDMYVTSDVLIGSGISSSAAFENLISIAIDSYYNADKAGPVEIAKIGQHAENVYFGKNCGLMDQMVSSVGGLVFIDFRNIDDPVIEKIGFDLSSTGHQLIITDTKGNHADLTDDYAAIRNEMESVARIFDKTVLREVKEADFRRNIVKIRETISDRAVLRAAHFFDENKRAAEEADLLKNGDFDGFLRLVRRSGDSSESYLQNLYSPKDPLKQEIPLALMIGRGVLGDSGAIRVHGGGFAGTIQAFVPDDKTDEYICAMNEVFSDDSCHVLSVRPLGAGEII